MKRIVLSVVAAMCAGFLRAVPEMVVGRGDFSVRDVASSEAAAGRLVSSDGGVIAKDGVGTWTVSKSLIDQAFPFTAQVLKGVLQFTADDVAAQANSVPAVMAKASLWLSADDAQASHFVAGEGGIDRWYDVREQDVAHPAYQFAQANYKFFDKYSKTRQAPVRTTYLDKSALYFGTAGSGVTMTYFKPDGATLNGTVTTRSVFLVLGVDNSVGFPLGSDSVAGFSYLWSGAAGKVGTTDFENNPNLTFFHSSLSTSEPEQAAMQRARVYRDGKRVNPFAEKFAKGVSVWSVLMDETAIGANAFFNDRDYASETQSRAGGDYLHEAVVFTNVLTEAERAQVTDYLVRKWRSDLAPTEERHVGVAAQAVARLAGDGATTAHYLVSGEGTVEQVAGAALSVKPDAAGFSGTLALADDTAAYLRGAVPVKAVAGRCVTVTRESRGLSDKVVQTAVGRPDRFVKAGVGDLTVNALDENVRRIDVNEGRLTLTAGALTESVPGEDVVVPVANGDFETGWDRSAGYVSYSRPQDWPQGWSVDYNGGGGVMWVLDLDYVAADYTVHPYSQLSPALRPVKGGGVVLFTAKGAVSTSLTFARAGRYQLDFLCARAINPYCPCTVELIDGAQNVQTLGQFLTPYKNDCFVKRTLRFDVAAAGTYTLRFQAVCLLDYANYGVVLDDLTVRRIPAVDPAEWAIPGGDFERPTWGLDALYQASSTFNRVHHAPSIFNVSNTVDGWTFVQQAGFDPLASTEVNRPGVGLVTPVMFTYHYSSSGHDFWRTDPAGIYFNNTRPEETGTCELIFTADGAKAQTTFRPPAGTWQLKALMAHSLKGKGGLKATVEIAGQTVDLGTIKPAYQAPDKGLDLVDRHWPVAFAADGATDVTLTLEATGCGSYWGPIVDNLVLTRRHSLVRNGSFELETSTSSSGYTDWEAFAPVVGDKTSVAERQLYTYLAGNMGYDVCDGLWRLHLVMQGGMRQTLAFPEAGTYRLSFWAHARTEPDHPQEATSYCGGAVRAWFVPNGTAETNVLIRTNPLVNDRFVKFESVFRIDAPMSGTFGIHTDGVWPNDNQVDDIRMERVIETVSSDDNDGTMIEVADGARLVLPFDGTLSVGRLRVGGVMLATGTYSSANCAAIEGPGVLNVTGRGTPGFVMTFR